MVSNHNVEQRSLGRCKRRYRLCLDSYIFSHNEGHRVSADRQSNRAAKKRPALKVSGLHRVRGWGWD
jgi:hypothetical protein